MIIGTSGDVTTSLIKKINPFFGLQRIFKSLSFHCVWLGLIVLSGCVTVAPDPTQVSVPAGHGALVVRVLANNPNTPIDYGLASLTLQEVSTGKEFIMASKTARKDSEALFFGTFVPGKYQLKEISAMNGAFLINAPLNAQTKPFEISQGRLTDLGAIVMAFNAVGELGGRYHLSVISSASDSAQVLTRLPSAVRDSLSETGPLRQDISVSPEANKIAVAQAKRTSGIASQSQPIEGKTVTFGRTLGLISQWDPATQKWQTTDTGTSFSIRSISMLADGSQLIGSEQGGVFLTKDGVTRPVASPGSGTVALVGQSRDGEYLAVLHNPEGIDIYGSPGLTPATWHLLAKFKARFPYVIGLAANRLYVGAVETGWSTSTIVHSIDLHTHEILSLPSDLPSIAPPEIKTLDDGTLMASTGIMFSRKLFRSTDFGKSWTGIPLQNWMAFLYYRNAQTFYAQRIDTIGFTSVNTVASLLKSDDGGTTWAEMGVLPKFVAKIYVLPKPGWLLATDGAGDVHISSDDGRNWQLTSISEIKK